ncbi:LRR receptor-like serine/threonine-protein kinase EFR [Camellia lanceoleosa]|uniref:LRR receptor-like serine/threonine-protein kinase EFR n=1 Tax=Camellia lanceoleosa TaxID=1840588 RepID=A0ACC0GN18_9ERIC|nr:LRR receptor-like serine/threonine-protein kinase EFR [Camellia lanceoleosa]
MEKTWFLYLTALFLAQYCFLACFTMNASSFTTDQSALLAFKGHITFDNPHHILANNWSSATSVCDWIGVSCGKRHHRVVALNLPAMGIGGTIPPHIGNLSFLSYFNITNNTFQGHLPGELARLHLLNVVDFNFNKFSGGVPTWFGNLPKLQYLCLASNSFTGLVPPSIGNISTLESLDLRSNFLEGGVPEEIGYLTKLKWLQMGFNNLSGSIPPTIFNISSLQWIEFRHNMLSGSLPEDLCVFLPKLEFLRLSRNEFDGQIPTTLGECRELQFLSLSYNKFSGFIPKGIGNLTLLKILYLGVNDFTGKLPSSIGVSLPNLQILYLGKNDLSGIVLDSISNASKLVRLDIGYNRFNGLVPSSLGNLRLLEYISLVENNFTCESSSSELSFLISMSNCRELRTLWISNNPLNIILTASIGNLSNSLEKIDVSYCGIRGSIPSEIANLSNLAFLNMDGNELIGFIPTTIKSLSKLQRLDLNGNRIQGFIPVDLCYLKNLGLSLKCWVVDALPNAIVQVLDANLLTQDIEHNNAKVQCVSSLMQLALNCSADSPKERMIMKDVLVSIKKIRLRYVENCK